jgi:hypothetical protein
MPTLARTMRTATVEFRPPVDLTRRWGPGLADATPAIDVPKDWRWTVANWPHDRWVAWRRRSAELQPEGPTAEQIAAADHEAYLELVSGSSA